MTPASTPKSRGKLLHASTLLTRDQAITFLDGCLEYSNINLRHDGFMDFVPVTHVEGYGDKYALGHIIGETIEGMVSYYRRLIELGDIQKPDPFAEVQP
jgi:hypothetical protein